MCVRECGGVVCERVCVWCVEREREGVCVRESVCLWECVCLCENVCV